jgi:hypothetical protein
LSFPDHHDFSLWYWDDQKKQETRWLVPTTLVKRFYVRQKNASPVEQFHLTTKFFINEGANFNKLFMTKSARNSK